MIRLEGEEVKIEDVQVSGIDDGELDAEVNHRVQSGWRNWKNVSGVVCDRRMKVKIKGKVYKTIVRPAMVYGAETWAVKKAHEKKMEVAEIKMLRWMCAGVTRLDEIRNEKIRGSTKVGEISKKVQECRMRWYGHVTRRDEEYVGKRVMGIEVQGSGRGRPRKRWADCVKDDPREKGLSGEEVYDRAAWRRLGSHIDPT